MNSQLYIAASGMLVEERRLELTANNLANVSTPGFRARRAFAAVFEGLGKDTADTRPTQRAVALAGSYAVPGPGPMQPTGRALDIALEGEALLAVETPSGSRAYTRAGNLLISPEGTLTDGAGNPVLGEGGGNLSGLSPATMITPDGNVVDGPAILGRLLVVRDPAKLLVQAGGNLLSAEGGDEQLETVADPRLLPGFLEGSATDPVRELVYLMESQRAFESYQKLITLTNDVNRRAVNEIAGG